MTQKEAETLGYSLLRDSPLSNEARSYVESSLPYILQRFYLAGYEVVPANMNLMLGDTISREQLGEMKRDRVIY